MTEETAKALAEAMNNLVQALNALPRDLMGIRVNHVGQGLAPSVTSTTFPQNPHFHGTTGLGGC